MPASSRKRPRPCRLAALLLLLQPATGFLPALTTSTTTRPHTPARPNVASLTPDGTRRRDVLVSIGTAGAVLAAPPLRPKSNSYLTAPNRFAHERARSVFADSKLLRQVQASGLFRDCKEFVDMVRCAVPFAPPPAGCRQLTPSLSPLLQPMRCAPEEVLAAHAALPAEPNVDQLRVFVAEHFDAAGADVLAHIPADFTESPAMLSRVSNPRLRRWAHDINQLWLQLFRVAGPSVAQNPERHSLMGTPAPFVIPGGRFREHYYWDSYW